MVQLTPAVVREQAEDVSAAQSYFSLHHLPQTTLVNEMSHVGIVSPQPSLTTQEAPSGHQSLLTSTTTLLNSSDNSSCPTQAGTTADPASSFVHPCSTFSTMLDTLPVTVLGSELQSTMTSVNLSGSASGDAGKTFEVIPVTEVGYVVDNYPPSPSAEVAFSTESSDSLTGSVDSLLESKGYGSDCSDVYMNSDYTDTVSSADSTAFLLTAGHSHHRASTDSSEFLLPTHPENASECLLPSASQLSSEVSEPLLHTDPAGDSSEHLVVSHKEESTLHHSTNVYSNDAFSEGHSTSSESLSQAQDFCESFPSISSEMLLQTPDKESTSEVCPDSEAKSDACTCNNNNSPTKTHFSYEAFRESLPLSNSCSRAHAEKEPMLAEAMADNLVSHCIVTVPPLWEMPIAEEDSNMATEERDDHDADKEERTTLILGSGESGALEQLVSHLAEQHPQEVVDIRIEVLDQPLCSPTHGSLDLLEPHWMQSTDSLHHYKLLKQGRCPNTSTSQLHMHALSGLRANTMNNLHERSSFLNLTAASVTNLGQACQKALSYVRADMEFGSMMSLGRQPGGGVGGCMDLSSGDKKKGSGQATVASGCHTRNVLYMALLVTLLLIAVNTTRNLQSSLNQEGGVGIICLAAMFASYTMGSLLSPVLVQRQGVRVCVVAGLILQLLYVAANLHATLWLMLPASLGGGASLALIWNAMSTYIVLLARGESDYNQKPYQRVADKFFGIFCLIYQSNLIIGNLIASLVLTFAGGEEGGESSLPLHLNDSAVNQTTMAFSAQLPDLVTDVVGLVMGQANSTDYTSSSVLANSSTQLAGNLSSLLPWNAASNTHYHLCGSEFCHHFVLDQDSSSVPARTVYLLFGIFMFLVVIAILIAIFLLEPLILPPSSSTQARPWHTIRVQFVSLLRFSTNIKFVLILPLLLYGTMQFSFVCSEVMMAYVTCPVGVWLVGYTMIGYGVSCSLGSYITQALVPRLGRGCFIATVS